MNQPETRRIERAHFDDLESDTHVTIRDWIEAATSHLESGIPTADEVERLRQRAEARFNGLVGFTARQLLSPRP